MWSEPSTATPGKRLNNHTLQLKHRTTQNEKKNFIIYVEL